MRSPDTKKNSVVSHQCGLKLENCHFIPFLKKNCTEDLAISQWSNESVRDYLKRVFGLESGGALLQEKGKKCVT